MLDRDLAELYEVQTKALNQAAHDAGTPKEKTDWLSSKGFEKVSAQSDLMMVLGTQASPPARAQQNQDQSNK